MNIAPDRYAIEFTWKPEVLQSGKGRMSVELVGVKGLFSTTGGLFSADVVRPEAQPGAERKQAAKVAHERTGAGQMVRGNQPALHHYFADLARQLVASEAAQRTGPRAPTGGW